MYNQFQNPHLNQRQPQQPTQQSFNQQVSINQMLGQLGQLWQTQGPTPQSNQLLRDIVTFLMQNSAYKDVTNISNYISNSLMQMGCNVNPQSVYQMVSGLFQQQVPQQGVMQQYGSFQHPMQQTRTGFTGHHNTPSLGSSSANIPSFNEATPNTSRFGGSEEPVRTSEVNTSDLFQPIEEKEPMEIKPIENNIKETASNKYIKYLDSRLADIKPSGANTKVLKNNMKTDCFEEAVELSIESGTDYKNEYIITRTIVDKPFYKVDIKGYIESYLRDLPDILTTEKPINKLHRDIEFSKDKTNLNVLLYLNIVLTSIVNAILKVEDIYEDEISIDSFCEDMDDLIKFLKSVEADYKKLIKSVIEESNTILHYIEQFKEEAKMTEEEIQESLPLEHTFVYAGYFAKELGLHKVDKEFSDISSLDLNSKNFIENLYETSNELLPLIELTLVTLDREVFTIRSNEEKVLFIKQG